MLFFEIQFNGKLHVEFLKSESVLKALKFNNYEFLGRVLVI